MTHDVRRFEGRAEGKCNDVVEGHIQRKSRISRQRQSPRAAPRHYIHFLRKFRVKPFAATLSTRLLLSFICPGKELTSSLGSTTAAATMLLQTLFKSQLMLPSPTLVQLVQLPRTAAELSLCRRRRERTEAMPTSPAKSHFRRENTRLETLLKC